MIQRLATKNILRLSKQYPVITVLGPRQSGKTILCQHVFPDYVYVSLENLEERARALRDPKSFLKSLGEQAIIDEIQRVPELLSYIQTLVDEKRKNGLYILTGSQQFDLMQSLTQSLAGRTAIIKLLPFSIDELHSHYEKYQTVEEYLYTGFYPRIYDQSLNPTEAYSFYVNTYLEKDIRSLINIKNYIQFDRFLKICASRTGQILNLTSLGNDCGLSNHTVNAWLSILEASFITYRVYPHFKNFSKRLIKAPKLYFYDVGLVSYLLGIEKKEHLNNHPLKGALFETLVMGEMIKLRYNAVKESNLYYFRDNTGHEIDALIDQGTYCHPVEIKLSETVQPDFFNNLKFYYQLQKNESARQTLIYGGHENWVSEDVQVCSYLNIEKIMD